LTKIFEEGLDFKQALILAQQSGFAESDRKWILKAMML
jgi:homoserine dehydrogenase